MTRLALLLLLAAPVLAQTRMVTPFVGVQGGGTLYVDGERQSVETGPAFGVMVSFDRGRGRLLDFVVAWQETEAGRADVSVDALQLGGRYLLRRDRRANPYIAATLGGTRIATESAEAVRFSFAGGVGAEIRITPAVALIVDGRLYTTLFGDEATFECRNLSGCVTGVSGRSFQQAVASAGLAFRF